MSSGLLYNLLMFYLDHLVDLMVYLLLTYLHLFCVTVNKKKTIIPPVPESTLKPLITQFLLLEIISRPTRKVDSFLCGYFTICA